MRSPVLTSHFLRFCVVGAAGFFTDAGLLVAVVAAHLADPLWGRLISSGAAVGVTFWLNRRWTFYDDAGSVVAQLSRYLGVQGVGFMVNLATYSLLYLYLPKPFNAPVLCFSASAACALTANYIGARLLVFRKKIDVV